MAGDHVQRAGVVQIVRNQRRGCIQPCVGGRAAVTRIACRAVTGERTHDVERVHHADAVCRRIGEIEHGRLRLRQMGNASGHADDGVFAAATVPCEPRCAGTQVGPDRLRTDRPDTGTIGDRARATAVDEGRSFEIRLQPWCFRSDRTRGTSTGMRIDGFRRARTRRQQGRHSKDGCTREQRATSQEQVDHHDDSAGAWHAL